MIKVLIAEDMPQLIKKYQRMLEKDRELQIVACVQSGYEAVMMAAIHKPDVVLMDIEMETRMAGLEATKQILSQFPLTKIIILTVYEDDESVFSAFQLGVSDYILKNSTQEEIITCIKDAYNNCSPIRPVIAQKIRREFQRVKTSETSLLFNLQLITQLTPSELDILNLLSRGYSRTEICEIRCVEPSTLKTHIHNILKKFDQESIADVIEKLNSLKVFEYLNNLKDLSK